MSSVIDDLFAEASKLPDEERAALAGRLLLSLEPQPADDGVEEAWAAEIKRRMDDYRAGRVKTIGWDEARAHLHRHDR